MLTEGEVRALAVLHGEPTVSELATNLDRSLSYTSELVERLETAGLVEARRQENDHRSPYPNVDLQRRPDRSQNQFQIDRE